MGQIGEFLVCQFSPLPACYDPAKFRNQEFGFLFAITFFSAIFSYWPRFPNEPMEIRSVRFEKFSWPACYLSGWEITVPYFLNVLRVPGGFTHVWVLFLRYQTLFNFLLGQAKPHISEGPKNIIATFSNFLPWLSENILDELKPATKENTQQQTNSQPEVAAYSSSSVASEMLRMPATPKITKRKSVPKTKWNGINWQTTE